MKHIDIEDLSRQADKAIRSEFPKPTTDDITRLTPFIADILACKEPLKERDLNVLRRKYKFSGKRSFLFQVYLKLLQQNHVTNGNEVVLRKTLQIKACKSWSGITSITIFTSPYPEYTNEQGVKVKQEFSCAFNCHYCPKEPDQPRSYLKGEPGVLRANKNDFDCARQMWDRMNGLFMIGSSPLKCEIIVSGGTWTSYPMQYREEFCRDVYYAANTFWDNPENRRDPLPLEDEKLVNQSAISRIVGLTIETRPDTVDENEMKMLRKFGVTRVQLGIQHVDDNILNTVNRKCPTSRTIQAIELLKRNCFKIDAHWMPNLPGASPELDRAMFIDTLLGLKKHVRRLHNREMPVYGIDKWEEYDLVAPGLSTDQWKIYPTAVTPWTEIEHWFREGSYVQYHEKHIVDILYDTMCLMFPWIRINRCIRDIPHSYIYNEKTGSDNTNMRQELDDIMKAEGMYCMDIRNREVKNKDWDGSYIMVVRRYEASNGYEYFISAESKDNKTLYGFTRLRLDNARNKVFYDLHNAALIRELHVYGDLLRVGDKGGHVQHKGIGMTLMSRAESVALAYGYNKIAVIAAEGTKPYYREKLGYVDGDYFMVKMLAKETV